MLNLFKKFKNDKMLKIYIVLQIFVQQDCHIAQTPEKGQI
jgi:hypothetical protein